MPWRCGYRRESIGTGGRHTEPGSSTHGTRLAVSSSAWSALSSFAGYDEIVGVLLCGEAEWKLYLIPTVVVLYTRNTVSACA